jgi:cytochrome c oxidase assembly protein subunit 15
MIAVLTRREARRRHLQIWLLTGAGLTFLILVVGGITRLTLSGLSIVEWKPITGVIPPLTHAEWQEAFRKYQQFPEYQKLRQGMTLAGFQSIFLWEYAHRLLARLIGLVFALPCIYFWLRGYFDRRLKQRVLVLFGLGALQGLVGWYMVKSGLVDDPHVSHYRLATHLFVALSIIGYSLWLARDLKTPAAARPARPGGEGVLAGGVYTLGGLLLLQILWGAFTAGLHAGLLYNTFPTMGGRWVPLEVGSLRPLLSNAVANPVAVQWVHRILGTVLALAALGVFLASRRPSVGWATKRLSAVFAALVLVQYAFGILTLLHSVPVYLGAIHQATAVIIFGTWVLWLHRVRLSRKP